MLKEATHLEMDFSSPDIERNEILILTRKRNCPSDKGLTLTAQPIGMIALIAGGVMRSTKVIHI
ncbi:hypothetical protein, partial [Paraburkholderia sp. SIMBA_054]|uniref:hypothetical protein n=1 Tax=Paraburkholderia sp. SIMBA_054 TaxID=3085795 RepID=UPI0039799A50